MGAVLVRLCGFFALTILSVLPASAYATARHELYVYYSEEHQWCGLGDDKAFRERADNHSASVDPEYNEVYETATVWLDGPIVTKIEVWTTTAEAESERIRTYYLSPDGNVQTAQVHLHVIVKDPGTNQVDKYVVRNGAYVRTNNRGKEEIGTDFDKIPSLSGFPFAKLLSKYKSVWTDAEMCE
jgi:hypothetical protein